MNHTTRRSFLAFLGSLWPSAGLFGRWSSMRAGSLEPVGGSSSSIQGLGETATAQTEFPFKSFYKSFPQGQPAFPRKVAPLSFLHPNGKWVVLPCASGGYEVWDWRKGIPVREIEGSGEGDGLTQPCGNEGVIAGCFTADGLTWLTVRTWRGGDDGQALVGTRLDGSGSWDQSIPMTIQIDPKRPVVHAVGFLMDGSQEGIYEVDTKSGHPALRRKLPEPLQVGGFSRTTCVSPDGRWLLTRHPNNGSYPRNPSGWWSVWSLRDGQCRAYKSEDVESGNIPGFSIDGAKAILSSGEEWIWSQQETHAERAADLWLTGSLSPGSVLADRGRINLVRSGAGVLEVRDSGQQRLIRRLVAFPPANALIAFGPRPNLLIASSPGGVPWLWNRSAPIRELPANIGEGSLERSGYSVVDFHSTRSIAWSRDGKRLAVGDDAGAIGLFDPSGFRIPDGTKGDEHSLGGPIRRLSGLDSGVRGLAFLPEGIVALAQDGTIGVWGSDGEAPLRSWKAHVSRSNSLRVAPDFRAVATGSLDGAAIWSLADGACLRRFGQAHSGASCLHFDAKGERLAVAYLDGWVAVFEVKTGKVLWETQAQVEVAAAVAFHPSGGWLVTLGWEGQLHRWDARSGRLDSSHKAPPASGCLAWSRDGKWLAIGGSHPEIRDPSLDSATSTLDFLWDAECT